MALYVGGTAVTGTQTLDATTLSGNLPAISGASLTGISSAFVQTGRVLLASSDQITLDNCFTSDYENYLMVLSDINCTADSQSLYMRLRTGGASGSTDTSSQYRYAVRYYDDDGSSAGGTGADVQQFRLAADSEENADWKGYNGFFTVYQPQLNTSTRIAGYGSHTRNPSDDIVSSYNAMHYDSSAVHTGIYLYYGPGIRSGASVTVWGINTT
jgi:hypothetical protein